jgi:hypothetical protein
MVLRLVRFNKWRLADYFGPDSKHNDPVPFVFEDVATCHLNDDNLGLDFALIHLRDIYKCALTANGIVPVTRSNWANAVKLDFDAYAMVGIPTKLTDTITRQGERDEQIGVMIAPVLVWIQKLDRVPAGLTCPTADWFVGQIEVPFNIGGMSGGPIFGFRRNANGHWTYHVVAVQSWWYPQSQVVFGCPVPTFMDLVERQMVEDSSPKPTTQ